MSSRERFEPGLSEVFNVDLYADVVEAGGLADAVGKVARRRNVDLGDLDVPPSWGRFLSVGLDSPRGPVSVRIAKEVRKFSITLGSETGNFVWANGSTEDLTEVVEVIDRWRRGEILRELKDAHPFMEYSKLSQGYEDGNPAAVQWEIVLTDERHQDSLALLQSIFSEERLRSLFPFFSHGALRLSIDLNDRTAGEIRVDALPDGQYRVESTADRARIVVSPFAEVAGTVLRLMDENNSA